MTPTAELLTLTVVGGLLALDRTAFLQTMASRPVVTGPLVSEPYVRMTLAVMDAFGVAVDAEDMNRFTIQPRAHRYRGRPYAIEPDASAASYFLAAAAITAGRITVEGLTRESLQGDVAFAGWITESRL